MSVKITGFDDLMKTLQTYGKKVANSAGRKAVRQATAVLKNAIKAEVPVDEGQLKKAMDMKVSGKRGRFSGVVGANVAKLQADHASNPDRPTNIDHLVNNGHVAPNGRFIAPDGFMDRGAATGMAAAEAKAEQVLRDAIDEMDTSDDGDD